MLAVFAASFFTKSYWPHGAFMLTIKLNAPHSSSYFNEIGNVMFLNFGKTLGLIMTSIFLSGCSDIGSTAWRNQVDEKVKSGSTARAFLSDKTVATYSLIHATQIEYFQPDGTAHLLYPGNAVVVRGIWLVKERPAIFGGVDLELCFTYQRDAAQNYAKLQSQGISISDVYTSDQYLASSDGWNCKDLEIYLWELDGAYSGDVFNLVNTRFLKRRLPKTKQTIPQALQAMGLLRPKTADHVVH